MTLNQKPVLLLDIDGVLNLFPDWVNDLPISRPTLKERANLSGNIYGLNIPLDAADLIDQLSTEFDMRWYTMWNQHARSVFTPTAGIRQEFDHFTCDHMAGRDVLRSQGMQWFEETGIWIAKTPLIPGYLGDRPFVWIDDDTSDVDRVWLEAQPGIGDHLLITVDPHEGMTQEHVHKALAWAQTLALMEEVAS
jgi:hypothetical protein